jgi:hypothetical protein
MSQSAQTKLLRFLQSREVLSLGTTKPRHLDVRVVAATNRAVERHQATNEEGLRYDLAARLGPEPLNLPPLRGAPRTSACWSRASRRRPSSSCPGLPGAVPALLEGQRARAREGRDRWRACWRARARPSPSSTCPCPWRPGRGAARQAHDPAQAPTREELATLLSRHGGDVARWQIGPSARSSSAGCAKRSGQTTGSPGC